MSKGLVQVAEFAVFPNVPVGLTVLLTVVFMVPVLRSVWQYPHPAVFNSALVYCMFTSFMLGFHVHEKAILQVLLPLGMISVESVFDARFYCLLAYTSHVALFPLLFTAQEVVTRLLLVLAHATMSTYVLKLYLKESLRTQRIRNSGLVFTRVQQVYVILLGLTALGTSTLLRLSRVHNLLPFLPQMITSVVCAVGMVYCWALAYLQHTRKIAAIKTYCEEQNERPARIGKFHFEID